MHLTLERRESANEAALSIGLNVGDPVESLARDMAIAANRITDTLIPDLRWLDFLSMASCIEKINA